MSTTNRQDEYDVIIVGGSNAGLSAALVLGRARRHVLVCDTGKPVNAPAHEAHGFFTRDGTPPAELLAIGREQLRPYSTVALRQIAVTGAARDEHGGGFLVTLADGTTAHTRAILLATGATAVFPSIEGLAERWGVSVNSCPYCHGYEVRDEPLAAHGNGDMGFHYALMIAHWSHDFVFCTDGPAELTQEQQRTLASRQIRVIEEKIIRLEGAGRDLEQIVFADGTRLPRRALFFGPQWRQHSDLAAQLGCEHTPDGSVQVDRQGLTSVPWLYAAGDMTHLQVQVLALAVAEGAVAGTALNNALIFGEVAR
ncbi:MAG: NAD(P)/FAD-dependent oxidoreductase [Chloroflexota bacterium]|nr:NAD(P)/FAD-dependent oxidoreductase [Chloroflexota bacterium]